MPALLQLRLYGRLDPIRLVRQHGTVLELVMPKEGPGKCLIFIKFDSVKVAPPRRPLRRQAF
jgi:hypothetical protein